MKKFTMFFMLVALFMTGCNEPGMNVKMGSADAGAGVAIIGALEAVPVEHFEATKTNIIDISNDLLKFVEDGKFADLPLDVVEYKMQAFLIEKGYGEYNYIVDVVFQYVKTQDVDVTIIGENNIKLIKIALEETVRNAKRCTIDGRTKWKEDERRLNQLAKEQKISEVK